MHKNATTTLELRAEIQASSESVRSLAVRYGINPKTVSKWRKRACTTDATRSPIRFTKRDQAIAVSFRFHSLLPLDDCLYALNAMNPALTRASLQRFLTRYGVGKLPSAARTAKDRPSSKRPLGFFRITCTETMTQDGMMHVFVAMDRSCKLAYSEAHMSADAEITARFLDAVVRAVPYRLRSVTTDDRAMFKQSKDDISATLEHPFESSCRRHHLKHEVTVPNHPWSAHQIRLAKSVIQEAIVLTPDCPTRRQLEDAMISFMNCFNFEKRLKSLKGRTPCDFAAEVIRREGYRTGIIRYMGRRII